MKIFIDTAKLDEIKEACSWGIVDGVTTNPSLIKEALDSEKAKGKDVDMASYIREICETVGEGKPVSLEVVSLRSEEMVKEAQVLYNEFNPIAQNVVIKIPINTYMEGGEATNYEGLKAIKLLSKEGIPVNATLVMNPEQALLAAKAGARYASPFAGRVDDYIRKNLGMEFEKGDYFNPEKELDEERKRGWELGQDKGIRSGVELVRIIVNIYRNYGIKTEIIAASMRNARQVREIAQSGADIATIPFHVLEEMLQHPKTEEGIKKFSEDVVPEYRKLFKTTWD